MKDKRKDGLVFYISHYLAINGLNNEQLGRLFRAIFEKQLGNEVVLEADIEIAYNFINNQLVVDEKKYIEKCEKARANGKKGGAPRGNQNAAKQPKQPKTSKTTLKEKEKNNDKDLIDDYIRYYFNYLCIEETPAEEYNISLKKQANFFRQVVTQMIKDGKSDILNKLDLYKLSECWERMNKANIRVDKEQYFIKCLENEVR